MFVTVRKFVFNFLTERGEINFVDGVEGGIINFVLGSGMFEGEQVDKSVAPQHLVGEIRRSGLRGDKKVIDNCLHFC